MRAQLHGVCEPRYTGYTCWRGVAAMKVADTDRRRRPRHDAGHGAGRRPGDRRPCRTRTLSYSPTASPPDNLEDGLRRYERNRLLRANGFVSRSWRLGRMAQWSNPLACRLRDNLLRATPESMVRGQMRKILTMTPVAQHRTGGD